MGANRVDHLSIHAAFQVSNDSLFGIGNVLSVEYPLFELCNAILKLILCIVSIVGVGICLFLLGLKYK